MYKEWGEIKEKVGNWMSRKKRRKNRQESNKRGHKSGRKDKDVKTRGERKRHDDQQIRSPSPPTQK